MLRIELNNQPGCYVAGSIVSGRVLLKSKDAVGETIDIRSLSITFRGRSTTTRPLHESRRFRRSIQLFSQKQILCGPTRFALPRTLEWQDCPHQWSFHFIFPQDCDITSTQAYEVGPLFNPDRHQTLPISFAANKGLDKCCVAYELEAAVGPPLKPGRNGENDVVVKKTLTYYVPRASRKQDLTLTTITRRLNHHSTDFRPSVESERVKKQLSFGQKLGLTSSLDNIPKAVFDVKVQVPNISIIGQPVELLLHITHDTDSSTTFSPPTILLKNISVILRAETSICGLKQVSLLCKNDESSWHKRLEIANRHFDGGRAGGGGDMPAIHNLDLGTIMDLTLPDTLTPTFHTFNIARTYSILVYVAVQCAGKTFPIYGDYVPCTLLAKHDEDEIANSNPPALALADIDDTPFDEPPPPYELHVLPTSGRRVGIADMEMPEGPPPPLIDDYYPRPTIRR